MRKRVQDHIDNCITCLMSNSSSNRLEGEAQIFPSPKSPLEVVHLDHFGPLTESTDNYKHILVLVDAFTRFTWLLLTKSTGSKEIIDKLKFTFNTFGTPLEMVSDRGIYIQRIR